MRRCLTVELELKASFYDAWASKTQPELYNDLPMTSSITLRTRLQPRELFNYAQSLTESRTSYSYRTIKRIILILLES